MLPLTLLTLLLLALAGVAAGASELTVVAATAELLLDGVRSVLLLTDGVGPACEVGALGDGDDDDSTSLLWVCGCCSWTSDTAAVGVVVVGAAEATVWYTAVASEVVAVMAVAPFSMLIGGR